MLTTFTAACSSASVATTPNSTIGASEQLIQEPLRTRTVRISLTSTSLPTINIPPTHTPLPSVTPTPPPTPTPSPAPCRFPGQIIIGQFQSFLAGQPLPYRIYLPPCYGVDGRAYPTLYMLHGGYLTEEHWDNLGLDEAAEDRILAELLPPLLIVMPGSGTLAQNTSGGPYSFEGVVLNELIPFIEANYCASPNGDHRAIGGISRGGYWALEIAFRFPQTFASVGGHSVALLDTYAGSDINPQYTGVYNDLADLRVYLDIGADDWVINNIRRLHEDMLAAGKAHTWILNQGKHEDAYWSNNLSDYLEWYAQPWSLERESYPYCLIDNPG